MERIWKGTFFNADLPVLTGMAGTARFSALPGEQEATSKARRRRSPDWRYLFKRISDDFIRSMAP